LGGTRVASGTTLPGHINAFARAAFRHVAIHIIFAFNLKGNKDKINGNLYYQIKNANLKPSQNEK
jgi:hypothetical protein